MLSLLTECTILMLRVIHDMFNEQRITYEEFLSCTEVKIKFLIDNLDNIPSEDDRKKAHDILEKCKMLISDSNNISAFFTGTDVLH